MQASDVARAVVGTTEVVSELGLAVTDASVLHNSNKLALRLLPCNVFARVAFTGAEDFDAELGIARRLGELECPVASPEGRVKPRVYERDGFAVTLWTYYEHTREDVPPADYANALAQLHAGLAKVDAAAPHFSDRVTEAQELVANPSRTPRLEDSDRKLLSSTLRDQRRVIGELVSGEQLLHGEPHAGNLLNTKRGPLFIDLETCCHGPVEFDLAHVPEEVARCYAGTDHELLGACRLLVLAMVAAWRWDRGDQLPNGQRAGDELLAALRAGPPWPSLDVLWQRTLRS